VVANIPNKRTEMRAIRKTVDEGLRILTGRGDLGDFGRLLHEAWQIKRGLGDRVTSPALDEVYGKALAAGALGGKLLGAGGTGFMLFYVPPERRCDVLKALPMCVHVGFRFESQGSVLIHDEPERQALAASCALPT
jgi:D-glycero-alpha-D-manno-heptose-7-phosphate kinase